MAYDNFMYHHAVSKKKRDVLFFKTNFNCPAIISYQPANYDSQRTYQQQFLPNGSLCFICS